MKRDAVEKRSQRNDDQCEHRQSSRGAPMTADRQPRSVPAAEHDRECFDDFDQRSDERGAHCGAGRSDGNHGSRFETVDGRGQRTALPEGSILRMRLPISTFLGALHL